MYVCMYVFMYCNQTRSSRMWALQQESNKELDEYHEVIFNEIDVKLKVAAIHVERQHKEKVRHYINHSRKHTNVHTVHTYIHTYMHAYTHMSTQCVNRSEGSASILVSQCILFTCMYACVCKYMYVFKYWFIALFFSVGVVAVLLYIQVWK